MERTLVLIIEEFYENFFGKDGRKYRKKRLKIRCQQCGKVFILPASKKNRIRKFHNAACARSAGRKGGIVHQARQKTWKEKHGVDHPSKSVATKQKKINTMQIKYGVDFPLQSSVIYQRSVDTLLKNHNVKSPIHSREIKKKIDDTNTARYGVKNVFQASCVKEKISNTFLRRYGVRFAMQSSALRDRFQKKYFRKTGYMHPFSNPDVIKKIKQTCEERYGVNNSAAIPKVARARLTKEARKKAHQTMVRDGFFKRRSSKQEILLYGLLKKLGYSIETQKTLNDVWPIDVYLNDLNLFIQVDGVYWHGLDRPIEEIKRLKTSRDATILKKIKIDATQNYFCEKNKIKLMRISDIRIKKIHEFDLREMIKKTLSSESMVLKFY